MNRRRWRVLEVHGDGGLRVARERPTAAGPARGRAAALRRVRRRSGGARLRPHRARRAGAHRGHRACAGPDRRHRPAGAVHGDEPRPGGEPRLRRDRGAQRGRRAGAGRAAARGAGPQPGARRRAALRHRNPRGRTRRRRQRRRRSPRYGPTSPAGGPTARLEEALQRVLPAPAAARLEADPALPALLGEAWELQLAGHDATTLLRQAAGARGFAGAESVAQVLRWRLAVSRDQLRDDGAWRGWATLTPATAARRGELRGRPPLYSTRGSPSSARSPATSSRRGRRGSAPSPTTPLAGWSGRNGPVWSPPGGSTPPSPTRSRR